MPLIRRILFFSSAVLFARHPISVAQSTPTDILLQAKWTSDGQYHWLRCEVRNESSLMLVSNPIYINPSSH